MKIVLSLVVALFSTCAFACDPCALFNASRLQDPEAGKFSIAASEQYSWLDRPAASRTRTPKNEEFVRKFSVTQFSLAYDFLDNLGIQVNLPLIYRGFQRFDSYRERDDDEFGIGDASLLGYYTFVNTRKNSWRTLLSVFGGMKFPTGDTGSIGHSEDQQEEHGLLLARHAIVSSPSGGRVLSLGSGSYDFISGLNAILSYQRWMLLGTMQYTVRSEGDFQYRFGNDTVWSVGPGRYVMLNDENSLALRVAVSGEQKPSDRRDGALVSNSRFSNIFVGPELLFTLGRDLSGIVGLDVRVGGVDRYAEIVTEYRLRTSLGYRF